ncbi:MAG: hypothetical protein H3C41_04310 [Bacteroidales bacterium]|nr:hypothetical protein [Bacteroidales bacterium]
MNSIETDPKPMRPLLLTVFAILSFVGSGMSALSNLFVYFNHHLIVEMVNSGMFDQFAFDLSLFTDTNRNYFILMGLLNITSFSGVRLMWQLRWAGFHWYSISQLLMLIVSTIFIYRPTGIFPMFDLMLTLLFILTYFRMRDQMS